MKAVQTITEHLSIDNLPDEIRNLSGEMQKQAMQAANSLLDLGYKIPVAATMAVERVKGLGDQSDESLPYHVIPHPDGWAVMNADAERAVVVTGTKEEAVERGREIARNQKAKLVIHKADGTIQTEHSYQA